jgi:hypothetical protein
VGAVCGYCFEGISGFLARIKLKMLIDALRVPKARIAANLSMFAAVAKCCGANAEVKTIARYRQVLPTNAPLETSGGDRRCVTGKAPVRCRCPLFCNGNRDKARRAIGGFFTIRY